MDTAKTYSLKKSLIISLVVSLVFVVLTYVLSLTLGRFQSTLLPDTGASWYYWKLPKAELWATITMWVFYLSHQITIWWLIYKLKTQPPVPKGRIGRYNFWLLVVNAMFIAIHLIQTTLFYDALAQFVPVMSSQGSVIVMLVLILIMLNFRRGLFFGKKVKLPSKGTALVTKIHGYYISWAVIYTFWFHPMEGTAGHLLGFFYFFMLLTQLSLAKTNWHTNIKWITVLEVYVAFHGAVVAINAGNRMWPMFFFGFMMMFIVTQVYGIIKNRLAITGIIASYATLVLITYSGLLRDAFSGTRVGWSDIHQITWIPIILYGLVFVITWLMQGVASILNSRATRSHL
jgi:hypothetical protein